jgi:hypothetical protein
VCSANQARTVGAGPAEEEDERSRNEEEKAHGHGAGARGRGVCWVQGGAAFNPPRRRRRQTKLPPRVMHGPWAAAAAALATSCPLCVLRERERSHVRRRLAGCYACI